MISYGSYGTNLIYRTSSIRNSISQALMNMILHNIMRINKQNQVNVCVGTV